MAHPADQTLNARLISHYDVVNTAFAPGKYVGNTPEQVALSLGPTVLPSILRTAGTVLFLTLGYEGALTLWRTDRRVAVANLALFLCGSLGVLVYLNLHAGPSLGYGILPANTVREARERDYFFVFAFWAWGPTFVDEEPERMAEAEQFAAEVSAGVTMQTYVDHAMTIIMKIDYRRWKHPAIVFTLLGLTTLMLVAVFFLDRSHNTHRWVRLGALSFQPSEFPFKKNPAV